MVFNGVGRKLVIPLLVVLSLGWLLYMIGFIMVLNQEKKRGSKNIEYAPYYVAAAGSPLVIILSFLHAALSGPASVIFGGLTSFIGVFCLAGFGYVQYSTSIQVYYIGVDGKKMDSDEAKLWLMFVGSYMVGLSWMLVAILWNCFTYDWKQIQIVDIVDEEGNVVDPGPLTRFNRNVVFAGVARKLATVVILFVAASWCLYITGLEYEIKRNTTIVVSPTIGISLQFNVWAVCVIGLLAFLVAAGHAGSYGGASTALGISTSILGVLFVATVGYTAFSLGLQVYELCKGVTNCYILDTEVPKYLIYELSGSIGMCVAWSCVVALWPCYFKETEKIRSMRRSASRRHEYLRQVQDSVDERLPLLGEQHESSTQQHRSSISVF